MESFSKEYKLVKGLKGLRTGSIIVFVATIFNILVLSLIFLIRDIFSFDFTDILSGSPIFFSSLIMAPVVLNLLGFIYFYNAGKYLEEIDPGQFGVGKIGSLLMIIGAFLILIFSKFIPVVNLYQTAFASQGTKFVFSIGELMIINIVLETPFNYVIVLGSIFFGLMLIRLGEYGRISSLVNKAGLLLIISFAMALVPAGAYIGSFILLAAMVILFLGTHNSLKLLAVESE